MCVCVRTCQCRRDRQKASRERGSCRGRLGFACDGLNVTLRCSSEVPGGATVLEGLGTRPGSFPVFRSRRSCLAA